MQPTAPHGNFKNFARACRRSRLSRLVSSLSLPTSLTGSSSLLDIAAQISATASSSVACFASTCQCVHADFVSKTKKPRFRVIHGVPHMCALDRVTIISRAIKHSMCSCCCEAQGNPERGAKRETTTSHYSSTQDQNAQPCTSLPKPSAVPVAVEENSPIIPFVRSTNGSFDK